MKTKASVGGNDGESSVVELRHSAADGGGGVDLGQPWAFVHTQLRELRTYPRSYRSDASKPDAMALSAHGLPGIVMNRSD